MKFFTSPNFGCVILLLFICLTLAVSPAFAADPNWGSSRIEGAEPTTIDIDKLPVGTILASGIIDLSRDPVSGRCIFAKRMEIRTRAPTNERPKWTMLAVDEECHLVISAKWEGQLEDGPLKTIASLGNEFETETTILLGDLAAPTHHGICSHSFEKNEQYIITYGIPGPGDELTRHTGRLTYCYDGVNAQTTSLAAFCSAATWPPGRDWVVDECNIVSNNPGPASTVSGSTKGRYHCDPPGVFPCNLSSPAGYYHTLYSTIQGNNVGISTCTFSWTGQIVRGPDRVIVQGCS